MSAKITASRRRAFLTHLTNTGNVSLASERAKVSRSWVGLHRAEDPAFDAACREALAVAGARLGAAGPHPPPLRGSSLSRKGERGNYFEGHELVVYGTNGVRTQVRRARLDQWSPSAEDRFLASLAGSCNVKAACAEVGLAVSSAYAHRNRWPGFARRWDEAIEVGYMQIEASLLEAGGHNLFSNSATPIAEIPPMTFDQRLQLLHIHKHQVRALGKAPGLQPRVATEAEAEKALLKAVKRADTMARREEKKRAATK
ncbi:MAG: hypothetical protein ACJ8E4_02915 [Sphingomicrobium sp.]